VSCIEVKQQLCNILFLVVYCRKVGEACCCLLHNRINKLTSLCLSSSSLSCCGLIKGLFL
jgi:hypothetical protein